MNTISHLATASSLTGASVDCSYFSNSRPYLTNCTIRLMSIKESSSFVYLRKTTESNHELKIPQS